MQWPGEPNGWLINGKSISNYKAVDSSTKALSVIHVEPGKTFMFRFVAATSLSLALFGFDKHPKNLEIIEADGAYTKKQAVELMQIGSGQRYSALFHAKSCSELKQDDQLDYYIQLESRERNAVVTNYAVLRYKNTCNMVEKRLPTNANPKQRPMQLPPTIDGYLDYDLQPLQPNNFPTAAEVTRRVMISLQNHADPYFIWTMNNHTWSEDPTDTLPATTPHSPYLVNLYQNQSAHLPDYDAALANDGIDPMTKTYPAKIGEVLEIVFQQYGAHSNGSSKGMLDTHPMHGHGAHHYDIGGGKGAWDPAVVEEKLKGTQPVLRDTTMLYRYNKTTGQDEKMGWRVWRIRVDQPGVWMIHCHTLQHMVLGMQMVWVHGDVDDILKVGKPDVVGYLSYGGDVYGNDTHAPQVVHFEEME